MAAPTGGHPYNGDQRVPGEHGDNRFGFPAAPGGQGPGQYQPYQQPQQQQPQQGAHGAQGSEWPPQQPGSGWPQQPQQPQRYDAPQRSRIQPVQQQRRAPEPEKPVAHNPLVRPYAMTGGRTRPRYQLAIEALVSTTADPSRLQGQLPEHQRICRLCIEIKSVAEISALLSIPLGVARILVADLAEAGLVAIHQPGGDEAAGGQPDVTLLERVLSGLRKL
ncbi:DUF742 domain-containing protein [Streptomyces fimicarius]|uniref:DUF742 domain-containing protein n=2 Tax=Streptomyces TaxID=1883 RepID=A0AB33KB57_9ACTN|nr:MULTISPECIES: DUF742 domain-containing protein [Streptomyces]MCL6293326.1 DUF742 domain-containing protein [Streptomyces sp. 43Y-GA-1]MCX4711927.1 DUF742 domain-containing protein [Streptomyces griseus]MDX3340990.1 DUF742 domain-containing protein [Streptomyces sp. ME02-6979.5a]MDX3505342.1 DUF742 domain-containing protein [Streptomyces sp. ATCC51928]MDX3592995.1 DUF742 domain-containing protein [Streptomyces sp. ID03-2B]